MGRPSIGQRVVPDKLVALAVVERLSNVPRWRATRATDEGAVAAALRKTTFLRRSHTVPYHTVDTSSDPYSDSGSAHSLLLQPANHLRRGLGGADHHPVRGTASVPLACYGSRDGSARTPSHALPACGASVVVCQYCYCELPRLPAQPQPSAMLVAVFGGSARHS